MKQVRRQPILTHETGAQLRRQLQDILSEHAEALGQAADERLWEFVAVTGTYTAGENDHVLMCTGGPYTVTIPAASVMRNKRQIVKRADNGTSTLTVAATSGNIDGAASVTLTTAYQSLELFSDGAGWWLV